jgi:hypothetical protein
VFEIDGRKNAAESPMGSGLEPSHWCSVTVAVSGKLAVSKFWRFLLAGVFPFEILKLNSMSQSNLENYRSQGFEAIAVEIPLKPSKGWKRKSSQRISSTEKSKFLLNPLRDGNFKYKF